MRALTEDEFFREYPPELWEEVFLKERDLDGYDEALLVDGTVHFIRRRK